MVTTGWSIIPTSAASGSSADVVLASSSSISSTSVVVAENGVMGRICKKKNYSKILIVINLD